MRRALESGRKPCRRLTLRLALVGVVALLATVSTAAADDQGGRLSGRSQARFRQPDDAPAAKSPSRSTQSAETPPEQLPPGDLSPEDHHLLDLPTALRLADAENPQIQFARERIRAAAAELERADALWLPDILIGTQWLRHDGQIQDTRGDVLTVSRNSLFVGGGPTARVDLERALFAPLAARQVVAASQANSAATTNRTQLDVAVHYFELLRAHAATVVRRETLQQVGQVVRLGESYVRAETGLSEGELARLRVELRVQSRLAEEDHANLQVASAELARLLRLDPFVALQPAERQPLPIVLVDTTAADRDFAADALANRPEVAQHRALVAAAAARLREAEYGPLLPSVVLGYQAGGFGGGPNDFLGDFDGRGDAEVSLVWAFRNLGAGDRANVRQRGSEIRQARLLVVGEMDRIVAETAAALARARSSGRQLEAAAEAVEDARQSYELSLQLFREAGIELIRPIEVLQASQALTTAQLEYLRVLTDHNKAQFELHWALGYPVGEAQPEELPVP